MQSSYNSRIEDFYYDENVDVVNTEEGTVSEGKIIAIRGEILLIQNLKTNKEEQYKRSDNCILKQWKPGRPFLIFNRIDIELINTNYWVEGLITNINEENNEITVRYLDKNKEIKEEMINKNSERISPIGEHTSRRSHNSEMLTSDEINKKLFKNRKFVKLNKKQENKFRENISNMNLFIKDIVGDGNCMFRAISDQVYGNEEKYDLLRQKCMDYLLIERDFFEQFVEGGKNGFDEYINMKRKNGVWGDDIELQALSEIYNRPIEIYSNSTKPLKTFHENKNEFKREGNEKINNDCNDFVMPIRISYHGKNHYNSIVPNKENLNQWRKFRNCFLKEKNGEYEDKVLEQVKLNKENKKIIEENEKARKLFMEKRNKYLDDLLDDIILEEDEEEKIKKENKNNYDKMEIIMKQSELEKNEEDMINSAIKMSLENKNNNNKNEMDYFSIPSIQTALEFGFSLDDAILAFSIYGDNSDLVLQYLYSMQEGK
jgi:OTU domain-containing protein 5